MDAQEGVGGLGWITEISRMDVHAYPIPVARSGPCVLPPGGRLVFNLTTEPLNVDRRLDCRRGARCRWARAVDRGRKGS